MDEIPERYRNVIASLCRLYKSTIDPESITAGTHLKNDLGMKRIDMLSMETLLGKRYPGINGFAFTPGIRTVGGLINYIEKKATPSL